VRIVTLSTGSTALRFTAAGATLCCEAHKNFADESASLRADNVRKEGTFLPLRIYISLQVKPRVIIKECHFRFDLTFDDRLQKLTAKTNPAIARVT
jgi:hypothetical protein